MKRDKQGLLEIIKVPAGDAPPEVREAWVGLRLYYVGQDFNNNQKEAVTNKKITRFRTLMVSQKGALKLLELKNPGAAQWWKDNGYPKANRWFCFADDEVKIIKHAEGQKIIEVTNEMQGDPYR